MTIEFKLPELGENISSADIVKVLIKPGDKIEVDQSVVEIETDKANVEVPSEQGGIVKEVFVKDGSKVKVGDVLFTFDSSQAVEKMGEPEKEVKKEDNPKPEPKEKKPKNAVIPEEKYETKPVGVYEFKLPELGENISSAQITKVLVKKGDAVKVDQSLLEIETDKATVEVPSEVEGVVKEVKVKDGQTVKIGEVIITMELTSETREEKKQTPQKFPEPETHEKKQKISENAKSELAKTIKREEEILSEDIPSIRRSEIMQKIAPASPSVRRFAREIGVDIHHVSGSGPGGRISVEDIKAYAKNLNESISLSAASGMPVGIKHEQLPDFSKYGEIEIQEMTNVRRKTAEHLSYAWSAIPHVTQFDKADITELEKFRKKYSANVESAAGTKLTVTAILLKVCASALKIFPQFNSSIDMEKKQIIFKKYYSIGIAVDTDRGLLVPVIKDVDKKNITKLAGELNELSKKARDKKLTLEEMQGGNFSISNLGGIGGTYFTPIVNSPEVAILGVSRAAYEQIYVDGKFEARFLMPLSLSYDHRIIDGADAARFLRWIVQALENPFLMSLEG